MPLKGLDLHGRNHRPPVDNEEVAVLGEAAGGHRLHRQAVHHADGPRRQALTSQAVQSGPLCGELQGRDVSPLNEEGASLLRNPQVQHFIVKLHNLGDDGLPGGSGPQGLVDSPMAGPLLQAVPVQLRHHMLIPFRRHNGPCLLHVELLDMVPLVHGKAQRLVLGHGEGLLKIPHLLGLPEAAALAQVPGAVIVLQGLCLQAEDVHRPRPGKLQVQLMAHGALRIAPLPEPLQHRLPVLFSEMHGIHIQFPPVFRQLSSQTSVSPGRSAMGSHPLPAASNARQMGSSEIRPVCMQLREREARSA